jgi:hypothetical protein
MKLEFLKEGSQHSPLIRLYEFDQAEVAELRRLVQSLVAGSLQSVRLDNQAWVTPIGGCRLLLKLNTWDEGIRNIGPLEFECLLTADRWSNVEGLLEPFGKANVMGHQWLSEIGTVSLLISPDGTW